jgi:iron uptake system component EfeO
MRRKTIMKTHLILASVLVSVLGCQAKPVDLEADARGAVKAFIGGELSSLVAATKDLQAAAPAADADGWTAAADAAAVDKMRAAWKHSRIAYERIEGAIAMLFPDIDTSIDARYDDFIATAPDANLFDGAGVTGMHAVERILWADAIPEAVLDFESKVTGYVAPAFPKTMQEAKDFRGGLLGKLVADATAMQKDFTPLALDTAAAFRGVIGSMEEQLEKVDLAATSEEESRYAQHTLSDMRANLEGGQKTFAAFKPWLQARATDAALIAQIDAAFAALSARYTSMPGDGMPAVPADWNPDMPTAEALGTSYGMLRTELAAQCDPMAEGSLVALMGQAADLLGIAKLPE